MDTGPVAPELRGRLNVAIWVCDGCVREVGVLAVFVDGVDAEAVDASVEPEAHGAVVDGFAAFLVVPV